MKVHFRPVECVSWLWFLATELIRMSRQPKLNEHSQEGQKEFSSHILHLLCFCELLYAANANLNIHIYMYMYMYSTSYSLVRLVWQNTEELISRPFTGLYKIRLLLQDCLTSRYLRF